MSFQIIGPQVKMNAETIEIEKEHILTGTGHSSKGNHTTVAVRAEISAGKKKNW